jgi:hypothetical protein
MRHVSRPIQATGFCSIVTGTSSPGAAAPRSFRRLLTDQGSTSLRFLLPSANGARYRVPSAVGETLCLEPAPERSTAPFSTRIQALSPSAAFASGSRCRHCPPSPLGSGSRAGAVGHRRSQMQPKQPCRRPGGCVPTWKGAVQPEIALSGAAPRHGEGVDQHPAATNGHCHRPLDGERPLSLRRSCCRTAYPPVLMRAWSGSEHGELTGLPAFPASPSSRRNRGELQAALAEQRAERRSGPALFPGWLRRSSEQQPTERESPPCPCDFMLVKVRSVRRQPTPPQRQHRKERS